MTTISPYSPSAVMSQPHCGPRCHATFGKSQGGSFDGEQDNGGSFFKGAGLAAVILTGLAVATRLKPQVIDDLIKELPNKLETGKRAFQKKLPEIKDAIDRFVQKHPGMKESVDNLRQWMQENGPHWANSRFDDDILHKMGKTKFGKNAKETTKFIIDEAGNLFDKFGNLLKRKGQ